MNAAMAYTTDGALAVLHLQLLADDKHAQTVYQPAPVIRGAVLAQHPEIETILDPVFHSLTLERLQTVQRQDRRRQRRPQPLPAIPPRHGFLTEAAPPRAFAADPPPSPACAFGGFVTEAPNRLVSGQPLMLWQTDTDHARLAILARTPIGAFPSWPGSRDAASSARVHCCCSSSQPVVSQPR